ncbi:unnamed protein product [Brassica napus]|uniref:(rape) hypothetical protein n=1 Tax=Brassica napus TaxID=3708 RepID=A0A816QMD8_BRANA|nr:unnamed protein product [Brassica napus]
MLFSARVEANTIVVLLCDLAEWRQVLSGNLCFLSMNFRKRIQSKT